MSPLPGRLRSGAGPGFPPGSGRFRRPAGFPARASGPAIRPGFPPGLPA